MIARHVARPLFIASLLALAGMFLIQPSLHASGGNPNQGNLQILRGAISVYYGDSEGYYPTELSQLVSKYLPAIPAAFCNGQFSNSVHYFSSREGDGTSGWGYIGDRNNVNWGLIFPNCARGGNPGPDDERSNNAKLNTVRSALAVFYGDTEGAYPTSLNQLTGKYLPSIPKVSCHGQLSNEVFYGSSAQPNYAGGWFYVNEISSPDWGTVLLNCPADATNTLPQ